MRPNIRPSGHQRRDEVADLEEASAGLAGEPPECGQDAQEAAVETHTALPDGEDFQRIGEEVRRLIEQDFAEAAADDDAQDAVEQQVVDLRLVPAEFGPALGVQAPEDDEGDEGATYIRPYQWMADGAEMQGDGVELGVDEHGGARH
jgi:hypothetical protein